MHHETPSADESLARIAAALEEISERIKAPEFSAQSVVAAINANARNARWNKPGGGA